MVCIFFWIRNPWRGLRKAWRGKSQNKNSTMCVAFMNRITKRFQFHKSNDTKCFAYHEQPLAFVLFPPLTLHWGKNNVLFQTAIVHSLIE